MVHSSQHAFGHLIVFTRIVLTTLLDSVVSFIVRQYLPNVQHRYFIFLHRYFCRGKVEKRSPWWIHVNGTLSSFVVACNEHYNVPYKRPEKTRMSSDGLFTRSVLIDDTTPLPTAKGLRYRFTDDDDVSGTRDHKQCTADQTPCAVVPVVDVLERTWFESTHAKIFRSRTKNFLSSNKNEAPRSRNNAVGRRSHYESGENSLVSRCRVFNRRTNIRLVSDVW